MNTLLIFPPASDPAHPPLGIASLAGYLREKGQEVTLLDLSILSYHHLLSEKNLVLCMAKIRNRLLDLESRNTLSLNEAKEYRLLAENSLSAEYLSTNIGKALYDLRDPSTYSSRSRYAQSSSILRRAMEFVSAAHYPVRWYPRGFSMSYLPTKSGDVLSAMRDQGENLFISFYKSCLHEIVRMDPDLVGLSINYYCQLIPGLTLASILRKHLHCPVVVGGGLICFFEDQWESLLPFHPFVDAFIPYEGEVPLFQLISNLEAGGDLTNIAGLLRLNEFTVHYHRPGFPPDLKELPPPDFTGLPLGKYLAPQIVLPLLSSRGCYWGRCAFCSHDQLYQGKFRKKSVQQIIGEMNTLSKQFGAESFYFTDEAIPPSTAYAVAQYIRSHQALYRWFGEARLESTLNRALISTLAEGGCLMLIFGLESAAQRILDLMEKGISAEFAPRILTHCHEAGIRTFVMFFTGFPTETREEAERTIDFIGRHADAITHISFTNFILEKRSPVYANPQNYGIVGVHSNPHEDLKIYSDYGVSEGLDRKEAITFLDEVKHRVKISSLIETYLISRLHLIFLPCDESPSARALSSPVDLPHPAHIFPKVTEPAVPQTLAFNLDQIRHNLTNSFGNEFKDQIKKCPTNYLFDPETEKLVEVGDHGLLLLKPCNGLYSLDDIIHALGEQNRETIFGFYTQLFEAGFLNWENGY